MTTYVSHIALDRNAEEHAALDASYRRALEQSGRPLLSHGRSLPDDELLAKLSQFGVEADRQSILDGFPRYISAEALATDLVEGRPIVGDVSMDWIWIAVTCLWERWCPDLPNMEMIDDKMQAGYAALRTDGTLDACRLWLETWRGILEILDRASIDSLDEFDDRFGGTQCVFNWVQDFEMELHNAGLVQPTFLHERISLCEVILHRFSNGALSLENFRAALAQSHFELGNSQMGDDLFRTWLKKEPPWGWGWIAWSDCYWVFARADHKDAVRAEQILQEGLASSSVENRDDILERLQVLYEETGRDQDADRLRQEIEQVRARKAAPTRIVRNSTHAKPSVYFGDEGLPSEDLPNLARSMQSSRPPDGQVVKDRQRVGRNDLCPCGSGKKFKKCCAQKL